MKFPVVLENAANAGRNFYMRDELMRQARGVSTDIRRRMFVRYARAHHRIAMASAADARRLLATGVTS